MSKTHGKIFSGIAVAIMLCFAWLFFAAVRDHGKSDSIVRVNDGWTILHKDSLYKVSDGNTFEITFRSAIGDTVVLENTLPASLPEHPMLRFRTYHSAVEVSMDSVLYSYGLDRSDPQPFLGSGIHYVLLPENARNQKVRISIVVYARDSFSVFPYFDILPAEKSFSDYNAVHLMEIFIGLFLVLFGIILLIASTLGGLWAQISFRILMIGLISFLLGIWTLCYLKLFQSFSMDFAFNTILEFYTLYLTPLPFGLLLYDMSKGTMRVWQRWTLKGFLIVGTLFALVTAILHLGNLVMVNRTLQIFHIYIFVSFLFIVVHVLPYLKRTSLSGKMLAVGVVVFGTVAFADVIRYNAYRFFAVNNSFFEITWIPFGVLLFVILLIASYLYYLKDVISAKAEKDVLASMVYIDSLTGLYNRTKCSQVISLLNDQDEDFAVISIDMNGLKLVNDRLGHIMGDSLIKSFGAVFKKAFEGIGTAIRIGGDEFIAIVREEHLKDVEGALERLHALSAQASGKTPVPLEFAYGLCLRSELGEVSANDVYRTADKRMYDMKTSMKSDLVRR
ncbi:MAG: diguanylate cyclase [Fibrobacter sp.]|nr:diguanylate cyclase [Fibrobacter sp.]